MDSYRHRMTRYIGRYFFSFLHLAVFSIMAVVILGHPEWMLVIGENKLKILTLIVATLPLSFCLDYVRVSTTSSWSLILGVGLLFYVLSYFAFQNFRLPRLDFNYYNILYIVVFYLFGLCIVASSYFLTLPVKQAWNQVVYFLYSYLYAILYALVSTLGLLLILYLLERGLTLGLSSRHYFELGSILMVIFFQLYFLYIKSDNETITLEGYPTPLLIFVGYVLFPLFVFLSGIMAVILGLVLMDKTFGNGWVGYILIAYWVLGFLLFFFIYPIRQSETRYKWIKKYPRTFSILLIPLGLLMVYDVLLRVSKFGYTEPRYIYLWIGLLSIFLGIQYLIDRNNASLKRMGTALVIVLSLLLYGGLNMSIRSNKSQNDKVLFLLDSYDLIHSSKLDSNKVHSVQLHNKDRLSLISTLDYLESKQYSEYKKILPNFSAKEVRPYEYFDYTSDPLLWELLMSTGSGLNIKLLVSPSLTMSTQITIDPYKNITEISTEDQFANTQSQGSHLSIVYSPLAGYSLSMEDYLSEITEMLNLNYTEIQDSFSYYIADTRYMSIPVHLYKTKDSLDALLILKSMTYTLFEGSYEIKKCNAQILY